MTYENYGPFDVRSVSIGGFDFDYYTNVTIGSENPFNEFSGNFDFNSDGIGSYENNIRAYYIEFDFVDTSIVDFDIPSSILTNATINEYGTENGHIVNMEFEGEFLNLEGQMKQVSGRFNVKNTF